MLGGSTRTLYVLWGQTLSRYLPPYSPSGLVRGHVLRRYPVSGAVAAPSSAEMGDAEVAAHVSAAEWLPARTPAEVVLNANEFSALHSVPTVSPEDVRWCTRHLLATSSASTARGTMENSQSVDRNAADCNPARSLRVTATSSCETPSGRRSTAAVSPASVATNLMALREVLTEHRLLLAGAEALQTGVPISCILAEHEEAQMYLTWSLASHRAGPSIQGVLFSPCHLALDDAGADSTGFSAVGRGWTAPLSGGLALAAEAVSGGAESVTKPHQRLGLRERTERLALLHQRFEREVAHLHSRGPRGTSVEAFEDAIFVSGGSADGEPFLPTAGPRVPLLMVVTSTGNSLAAAVKAAAVGWARCACRARGSSDALLRCSVYAEDILWRPAPGTALVATWWAALLYQHHRSSITANAAGRPHSPPSDAAAQPSLRSHPGTRKGLRSGWSEGCGSASEWHGEESTAATPSLSPAGLHFHLLITGGDTADHFLFPLMAGVDDSIARAHAMSAHSSEHIGVTAQNGEHSGGDITRTRGESVACVSAQVQSLHPRKPDTLAVLLCYGCPAAQVAHLHAIRVSFLARHDIANTSATIKSGGSLRRESLEDALADRESAAVTSGVDDNLPSMRMANCAATGVVELCTEAPAVSMVAALPPKSGASRPSSVWTASALSLSYHLRGAGVSLPFSEMQPVPSAEAGAARSMTLEEAAARIFESSVLEPPLRRADFDGDYQGTSLDASQQSLYEPQTAIASAALHEGASLQRRWCSLCFAPRMHAPALLSTLVQRHFGQPLHAGHSFDALCRRGPAPSPLHVQMAQEVLRCATRGGCTHRRSPRSGSQRTEQEGADSFPSPASVYIAFASSATWASERSCANKGSLSCSVLPDVEWKHVCGGFILPLTAVGGRGSPYFVPCLLFTDLAEVASAIAARGRERRLPQPGSDTAHSCWLSAPASDDGRDDSPREGLDSGLGAPPQPTRRCSASDEAVRAQIEVLGAVAAVERSVFQLRCAHDTEMLGYRGVVAGNYLFVCCYPDAWQGMVRDALMDK
ncbi:hypothetical protein GH5_01485 [Leishmania sp. Ghana 2012 LV757]|uniref:hypothetical protein n=1 Tax=Leishmania sp. Ghana 2012 LV757 TaxID=2803181 RepID=UPI001B446EBF|nr:hypothetical protein GH5_01485 [Leishmania sp. Ghana 2012 LV757]